MSTQCTNLIAHSHTTPQENEIDQLVYQLCAVTRAELALVEGRTTPPGSTAAGQRSGAMVLCMGMLACAVVVYCVCHAA